MEVTDEDSNRKQVEKLTAINEYRQEVHELKLRLGNAEAMEREASQQVEALQAELAREKSREDRLSARRSRDADLLDREWTEKLELVEHNFLGEKFVYEDKIRKLEEKIVELENVSVLDSTETVIELKNFKSENQKLIELVHEFEAKLAKEMCRTASLESVVKDLSQELEVAKNNLEQKKAELDSAQEIIEDLRAEATRLRLEAESLRAEGASHARRGNSLFAEVEDRRKAMQAHLDSARAKLRRCRTALKSRDAEISKLRADKAYLGFEFKSLAKECRLTDSQWHSSYTQRIQELERTVRELRAGGQPPAPGRAGGDDDGGDLGWVSRLLADRRSEVRRLEEALEEKSVACLMAADCLKEARRDLQLARAENLSARATVMDLRMALLAANPNVDIDADVASTSLPPASDGPQSGDKENVAWQPAARDDGEKLARASPSKVAATAAKRELSDVTNNVFVANPCADEINFPVI
ncbi:protein Spindly isoform X2 [Bacillus rossius redtenbacheri]|uniref:protein Spindly isoform X2 n=1 Tax=Bacillus rossius redtenbacheri TaxID=93214 RepID=UPI002FDE7FE0